MAIVSASNDMQVREDTRVQIGLIVLRRRDVLPPGLYLRSLRELKGYGEWYLTALRYELELMLEA